MTPSRAAPDELGHGARQAESRRSEVTGRANNERQAGGSWTSQKTCHRLASSERMSSSRRARPTGSPARVEQHGKSASARPSRSSIGSDIRTRNDIERGNGHFRQALNGGHIGKQQPLDDAELRHGQRPMTMPSTRRSRTRLEWAVNVRRGGTRSSRGSPDPLARPSRQRRHDRLRRGQT